jgi:hypothetical protein
VHLGDLLIDHFGQLGRSYVDLVETTAPHAPLALLREALEREREYGGELVSAVLESVVQYRIVKRGAVSKLCHRFGSSPRIELTPLGTSIPHIEVERRPLSIYDEVSVA